MGRPNRTLSLASAAPALLAACGLSVVGGEPGEVRPGGVGEAGLDGSPGVEGGDAIGPDGTIPISPDGSASAVRYVRTEVGAGTMTQTVGVARLTGGGLFLAAITTKPSVAVSSVMGLGLVWHALANQCSARSQTKIELWYTTGEVLPPSNGQVSVLFAAQPLSAAVGVAQFDGASAVGRTALANSYGPLGACTDGTDTTAVNAAIGSPPPPDGALVFAALAVRNRTLVFGPTLVDRGRSTAGSGGDVSGLLFLESLGPVVSGTFDDTTDWAVGVTEILPR